MRHEHQTAKMTRKLTGMPHGRALHMARTGTTEPHQPVPDALTADQRAFESRLAFALIDAFPDYLQPHAFPWAIDTVRSDPASLDIFPAPAAAEHLLGALVPFHDRQYGGLRGAAGARVTTAADGWWILHDVDTTASVRIAAPASTDLRRARHRGSSSGNSRPKNVAISPTSIASPVTSPSNGANIELCSVPACCAALPSSSNSPPPTATPTSTPMQAWTSFSNGAAAPATTSSPRPARRPA
jgi:hypothetical protein